MVLEGFKKDSRVHMSAKPISLLEYLIRTYSNDGEVVMDNCAGSCSTGLAAFNTGRFFIGMENDKEIYATGLERLKDHTALWSNAEWENHKYRKEYIWQARPNIVTVHTRLAGATWHGGSTIVRCVGRRTSSATCTGSESKQLNRLPTAQSDNCRPCPSLDWGRWI